MTDLHSMWMAHKNADWPGSPGPHEGELMTLDTVISGCVAYRLENSVGLDLQRVEMVGGCLADLDALLPELRDDSREYFVRLRALGGLLLDAHPYG